KECPFDSSHGAPDSCVMQSPDGTLSAMCFHNSCQGMGWQEFKAKIGAPRGEHYDPPYTASANRSGHHEPEAAPVRCYKFAPINSTDFANADYAPTWLIDRLLVKNQPCVLGGPTKALKTSVALDMVISIGSGTAFLGQFKVFGKRRTAIISGESGEYTLQ